MKNYTAVLTLVNKIRAAQGKKALKKLPKGDEHDNISCPLARALDGDVGVRYIYFNKPYKLDKILELRDDDFNMYVLPAKLRHFVTQFDKGEYPELIK